MSSTAHRLFAARTNSGAFLDVAIAAAVLIGSLAQLSHSGISLIGIGLAVCATVPLIFWRRFPFGVFVVTAAATVLLAAIGYQMAQPLGPTAALYLLAGSRERETPWTWRTAATVVGMLVAYLGAAAVAQGTFPSIEFHTALAWAVAWFAGERTRLRREQIGELKERALRVERDAERERRLATAEERARIARDLHDSAGHAISVIAVRAGAARLRHHQDPDRSILALEAIEELARKTVAEIDQIVGTLRQGAPANGIVEAPLGLASLEMLIARHQEAGLNITFAASGTLRPLSGTADQAAYRILQEALTNAARHGTGSAQVKLAFGDVTLDVTVTNPVLATDDPESGRGHGLIGMRERATLLGGSFETERSNGSFGICAKIPYEGDRP